MIPVRAVTSHWYAQSLLTFRLLTGEQVAKQLALDRDALQVAQATLASQQAELKSHEEDLQRQKAQLQAQQQENSVALQVWHNVNADQTTSPSQG